MLIRLKKKSEREREKEKRCGLNGPPSDIMWLSRGQQISIQTPVIENGKRMESKLIESDYATPQWSW